MLRLSNFKIVIIAVLIALIGVASIYSSTHGQEGTMFQDIAQRQAVWLVLGLALYFIMSNVYYRRLWDITYPLYVLIIFLLFIVFVMGVVRLGAQRWLKIGWFNLQPSEIAKITVIIFLARYFSYKSVSDISLQVRRFNAWRGFFLPFILVAIPAGLVVEQPDLGSGLMIFFILMCIIFLAGVKFRYITGFIGFILISLPLIWGYLRPYQKNRLMVFLDPNTDPMGAGYNSIQAKIAIGSGGFLGKGWLGGTQSQLHFLPESHTDFIFSTFAETWGFVGCAVLFLLYYILINYAMSIGRRTNDYFGKMLAFGIALMIGLQAFVNIAMNIGLAPVVGIPLPLMSYGGSSMMVTFMALGILANIEKRRSF
ncbi:MAG TPA: rod shape-determining protein RodA [Candidatus Omnitrophota bacterium]|nr:rod shape-determining protein RodA [Candidatus Omnitrophota bacterium]HPT06860.1 rod shape-determining protein RodA [Candidatus Omnitrophota bacterium]